jgi:hypothetical protein
MLRNLNTEFTAAMTSKQEYLDITQAKLRLATQDLAKQRQELRRWQSRQGSLQDVKRRIRNLDLFLQESSHSDNLLQRVSEV